MLVADATPLAALQETGGAPAVSPPFLSPEIPSVKRWSVVQFTMWTGVFLYAADARWLADVGRCYEAAGRETERTLAQLAMNLAKTYGN